MHYEEKEKKGRERRNYEILINFSLYSQLPACFWSVNTWKYNVSSLMFAFSPSPFLELLRRSVHTYTLWLTELSATFLFISLALDNSKRIGKKKTIDDNFEKNLYFLSTLQRIQFSWNKSAYLFFTNKIKFRTIGEDNRSIISKFPFSWLIRTRLTFNPLMNNERMLYTWILWKWWKLWTL